MAIFDSIKSLFLAHSVFFVRSYMLPGMSARVICQLQFSGTCTVSFFSGDEPRHAVFPSITGSDLCFMCAHDETLSAVLWLWAHVCFFFCQSCAMTARYLMGEGCRVCPVTLLDKSQFLALQVHGHHFVFLREAAKKRSRSSVIVRSLFQEPIGQAMLAVPASHVVEETFGLLR